ncbi:MAG: SpoIIE family protein phosphatase [Bacteroidales bacterium]|nr:SpoIIE family protein phosphatase [Bacteroidales bacterium]
MLKLRKILFLLFSVLYFFVSGQIDTFPVYTYTDNSKAVSVQSFLYQLKHTSEYITIDSVSKLPFTSFATASSSASAYERNKSYWFVLRLKNESINEKTLYLTLGLTQSVEFYQYNPEIGYVKQDYGYDVPDAEKAYAEPIDQLVGVVLKSKEETLLFFRIKSELSLKMNPLFKIQEQEVFLKKNGMMNLMQGLFHGLIWMLIAYIFFVYLNLKDRVYLYYIFYCSSFSIAIFVLLGYPRLYLFPHITFNVLYSELIILIGSTFYMLLFRRALNLKELNIRLYNFTNMIIYFSLFGVVVCTFFLFYDFYIYNLLCQIFSLFELLVFCFLLMTLFRIKNAIARYLLIGNLSMTFGAVIIIVSLLFFKDPFLKYFPVFQAGVTLEVLFFAIGLSKRFQFAEQEKRLAQDKLIEELTFREKYQQQLNDKLEQKVRERTQIINQSKEEILQQQEYIEQKNVLLEASNKSLTDNLEYAGFIQNALLTDFEKIKWFFKDAFLIYKPQSYVSGDFYMFFSISEYEGILLTADCTGHGVPGAMLTLIAQDFLSEIIYEKKETSPANILLELEKRIVSRLLNVSINSSLNEGLDIAVVYINKSTKTLSYAGAKMPLLVVNNTGVNKVRGTLYGIGGAKVNLKEKFFTDTLITFNEGDRYYIYSDGFHDQLQAYTNKKYLSKRFYEKLQETYHHTFEVQKKILADDLDEWKGGGVQTDDIIVIGFTL